MSKNRSITSLADLGKIVQVRTQAPIISGKTEEKPEARAIRLIELAEAAVRKAQQQSFPLNRLTAMYLRNEVDNLAQVIESFSGSARRFAALWGKIEQAKSTLCIATTRCVACECMLAHEN